MSIASQGNTLTKRIDWARLVFVWCTGSIAAYFLTSFFSNFYPLGYQFVLLSLFFQLLCGMGIFLLSGESVEASPPHKENIWLSIPALLPASALSVSAIIISWQFPGLFDRGILFMDVSRLRLFLVLSPISLLGLAGLVNRMEATGLSFRLKQTPFVRLLQRNAPGILLAALFFFTYFTFAQSINFPGFRTLDLYFDTDISVWLQRLTTPRREDVEMVRAVHPAILLFLRPPIWLVSVFLRGDRLQALFIMNALAGAACVLLTWCIVRRASGSVPYALIMASLLGASCSHLLLATMSETYIYSAAALLFFVFLLQRGDTSLKSTVPAGIFVFGITVTNIVQTGILYFFASPRIKQILKYGFLVVLMTFVLHLLQVGMYPNARSLFQPSNLLHEQYYILNPFDFSWRVAGRLGLIARAIPLYGVVAPTPFVLLEEIGMDVPNFRTYQILLGEFHVAGYRGLADLTVKFWIVILGMAGIVLLMDLLKSPKKVLLPASLVICLGFNFVLHVVYGDDPMLYSPDWVYGLVLFVALALQKWAGRTWLQLLLLVFLALLVATNLGLLRQIMEVSAPFYSLRN
jgi:hypothetical protein